ncbi:hypothetical protein [Pseudoalteromonas obscura]|uniref:hypothetical protein n=1 Tax=Pseudoalteromonas obscura TaxID=3048491 RepID=UPI0024DEF6E8|nr:hypothetical protein [Pseudoalteromonas sp. P94(2023)]
MYFILVGITTFISVFFWIHKGGFPPAYLRAREAEVVEVSDTDIKVCNKLTGYSAIKSLTEIKRAKYRKYFGFEVVIIEFDNQERFELICYKNSKQLESLLNKKD